MPPSELFKSNANRSNHITCRRRLQNNFEDCEKNEKYENTKASDRSVLSVLSLNDSTRKLFKNGADMVSKTFNNVRTTFGTLTQKFRMSTRRRQILEEGPMTPNCATPYSFSKQVLGRTPTKLYSPFGIDTPYNPTTYDKENQAPR